MARLKNKNKYIHNQHRKKTAGKRKVDIEDPYHIGNGNWTCRLCGSKMHPYKQDEYGDIIMACNNSNCVNSEGFDGSVNVKLSKLTRELQLHSRYYTDYLGGYYGKHYDPWRKAPYMEKNPKILRI